MKETVVAFDLDDTLISERAFLHLAYQHIARLAAERYGESCDDCLAALMGEADAFDTLHALLKARRHADAMTPRDMVAAYRDFRPVSIPMMPGAEQLLEGLHADGYPMALVTDGRLGTQCAKIEAAGIRRYIADSDIIISEATGHEKRGDDYNFRLVMERHPAARRYCYVGNNPTKDFAMPRSLGWLTIGLRDTDGTQIHPQLWDAPGSCRPDIIVDSLSEIKDILEHDRNEA